jgi:uncharacterized membrane protein SpoIIM required for sporulation
MTYWQSSPAAARLAAVCLGYLALLVAAVASGAALAAWQGHALILPEHAHHQPTGTEFLVRVVEANGRVWLYTCTGLVSFGIVGVFVLVGNAFRFGMDVVSIARGAPRELVYLLPHGVLEFGAFTLAGAACQYLAWCLFDLLVSNQTRVPARAGVRALALSFVLLMLAACLETFSYSARFG